MKQKQNPQRMWLFVPAGIGVLLIVFILEILVPYGTWVDYITRGAAIVAYLMIFFSIVMTNFRKEMALFFGNRFIKIHHIATIVALTMIVVHPLFAVLNTQSLGELVPVTSSGYEFFLYGGRQALYLFIIATVAALLYRTLKKSWRVIHWFTYIAFIFATVHGILLGSNFQFLAVRIVVIILAVAVVSVFILKRAANLKRKTKKQTAR